MQPLQATETVPLEHSEIVLPNHHQREDCYYSDRCTLHNRSNHYMRKFPQVWNPNNGIIERVCEHGIGHPDPDELPGAEIHFCDACCVEAVFTECFAPADWASGGIKILEDILESHSFINYIKTRTFTNNTFRLSSSAENLLDFHFNNLNIKIVSDKSYSKIVANIEQLSPIHWYIIINACVRSLALGEE